MTDGLASATHIQPDRSGKSSPFVAWSLYPASWALILALQDAMVHEWLKPGTAVGLLIAILVVSYVTLEFVFPFQRRWSMTGSSLKTDLTYLALNGATLGGINFLLGLLAINAAGRADGYVAEWPLWLQVPAIFIVFELIQYTIHRFMHEGGGRLGDFAWALHVGHHLPERVYVFMHVVGHPLNLVLLRSVAQILPIWLLGFHPLVAGFFAMVNAMHGTISHFNVDVRMGWFNYVFVGPELHRYHHSANYAEAKNYGATISIFDQLFGTFVYRPGVPPEQLGVEESASYPPVKNFLAILRLPFRRHDLLDRGRP